MHGYAILFVSGLGEGAEEESLDIFNVFGASSLHLLPAGNHLLQDELGRCAYIVYTHRSDAEFAKNIMDGITVDGSLIRVSWSVSDPEFRQKKQDTILFVGVDQRSLEMHGHAILFVSGLDEGAEEESLDIFNVFGPASLHLLHPAENHLLQDELGRCAYIVYTHRSDAEFAKNIMDGITVDGSLIRVSWSVSDPELLKKAKEKEWSRKEETGDGSRRNSAYGELEDGKVGEDGEIRWIDGRKKPVESSQSYNEMYGILFVSGLGVGVNEDSLGIFKVFGPSSVYLLRPASHQGLGCAYITYSNRSDADRAMKIMHGFLMDELRIRVIWSLGDPTIRQNSASIFIKNLIPWASKEDTERQLVEAFQNHGRVLYCRVPVQERGGNRGFAIVQMGGNCEARRAVAALHDTVLNHDFGEKLYVIDASAVCLALSKHSKTSDTLVSDGPGECFVCCSACSTRVSVCNYMRACIKCAKKYGCPICDSKYHP
ncbi:polyadenylate-binding protein 2 [Iris pallida]|uniref:Polyadenylate-binding protein 2 n=1 Tax=Iris pallida TaxID=29817 RepID=A0AAX6I3R3_IRIPA|nr:polyadenylate-binding protein 2 [Iris pallida]